MADATVVRWRRYGKDRLYVNGPAGERYGWGDLLTGIIEVTEPSRHELVETLVSGHPAWTSRGGTAAASAKSGPLVSPPPSSDAKTVEHVLTSA